MSETLEPDPLATKDNGYDSACGSDIESNKSASITSSIIGYTYENGRRYHAFREGEYYLPNDDNEQGRLNLLHHIWALSVDGALYLAPIDKDIKRCLDFGTGTGIWAIDFADEQPNAEVIGTDLSPIQPGAIPPNCRFYVDDVEDDWGFTMPDEAFDFIHGRSLGGAIADWPRLFRQVYHNLKPGGWFEMQEYEAHFFSDDDPSQTKCPNIKRWINLINQASSKFGKEVDMAPTQKQLFENAGFVDVQEVIKKVPMGGWAKGQKNKEMGYFHQENILQCVDTFTLLFIRVLDWTMEDCEEAMNHCRREILDPNNHLYAKYYFVYGRKPSN